MNSIENYGLDELLLVGIKSEIEAEATYMKVAENVKNPFLKERLEFLAKEEGKHRAFLENLFKERYPGRRIELPEKSGIALPEIRLYGEDGTMRDVLVVLDDAMEAEKGAYEFYNSLAERFTDEKMRKIVKHLALMEMDHFQILEMERRDLAEVGDIMEDASYFQMDGQY